MNLIRYKSNSIGDLIVNQDKLLEIRGNYSNVMVIYGSSLKMEVFESESKDIRARGIFSGKLFIIQKGSGAVGDNDVTECFDRDRRIKLREELISNGTLTKDGDRYQFQKDHTFNSPSEAASVIWGGHLNGKKVFNISEVHPSSHESFPIDSERAVEGYKKDQQLYVAGRNAKLAEERKKHDDYKCQACGFKLKVCGYFVIECHHTHPISQGIRETRLNDLVSLCPTCHRIAHTREPIYDVAEIAKIRQG